MAVCICEECLDDAVVLETGGSLDTWHSGGVLAGTLGQALYSADLGNIASYLTLHSAVTSHQST